MGYKSNQVTNIALSVQQKWLTEVCAALSI